MASLTTVWELRSPSELELEKHRAFPLNPFPCCWGGRSLGDAMMGDVMMGDAMVGDAESHIGGSPMGLWCFRAVFCSPLPCGPAAHFGPPTTQRCSGCSSGTF